MKKILIATAMTMICGSAFAQNSTGPAPQSDNMDKPGMSSTDKGGGSMSKNTTGMKKDSTSQGGASKDGQGQMNKGGTSK